MLTRSAVRPETGTYNQLNLSYQCPLRVARFCVDNSLIEGFTGDFSGGYKEYIT